MNSRTHNNKAALKDLDSLIWGGNNFFLIKYFLPEEIVRITSVLSKYSTPKKILSFVDSSIIYMHTINLCKSVISFDDHFNGILERIY